MNLVVEGIKKQYSKTVLQNINLTISKPGVYLIAGPNGSRQDYFIGNHCWTS